jgi:hypothetical protein
MANKQDNFRKGSQPDLHESSDDKKHLRQEKTTMDLPDVKDIPGQEHVRPMPPGEMADTTISSADEEGVGIIGLHDEEDLGAAEGNMTTEEKEMLEESGYSMGSNDDQQLKKARLDNADEDGTPLNENIDQSGSDLDVPGSEDDDANEEIGEEDEENNSFSLNDDKEDDINTRQ